MNEKQRDFYMNFLKDFCQDNVVKAYGKLPLQKTWWRVSNRIKQLKKEGW